MAWQKAFELGPCDVVVTDDQGTEIFRQTMNRGDYGTAEYPRFPGSFVVVGVAQAARDDIDQSVSVSVQIQEDIPSYESFVLYLHVIPSYSIADRDIRIAHLQTQGIGQIAGGFSDFDATDYVSVEGSGGYYSPDPCDLSSLAGRTEISMFAGLVAS